jgi:hypothetical protein
MQMRIDALEAARKDMSEFMVEVVRKSCDLTNVRADESVARDERQADKGRELKHAVADLKLQFMEMKATAAKQRADELAAVHNAMVNATSATLRARRKPPRTRGSSRATDPAKQSASRQLRPRNAEDIANEQTAELLALRIWAAMVAERVLSGMSALMELLESHLLDDDDEEADEGWLDDHHKREKKIFDETIADRLHKYPDINAISIIFARVPIQTLPERPSS